MTSQLTLPSSLKRRIIEKINANKLTIIVGPTGCGKSSIVPQVLLDYGIGAPILCTQPRRLAVVAVSSYVAKQRGVLLGGDEVGYHVGQDRMATHDTKLIFITAGVLLEELKGNGLNALTKYKVVIIDECHERSSESDLVLTIIKEFMISHPRSNLKLVLMSATFNHSQYSSFFRGVPGCDYVDTITIQTANSIDAFYSRVQTYYLKDIANILASASAYEEDYIDYCLDMKHDPTEELSGTDGGKALSYQLLTCIMALVKHLHNEESPDAIFLVFAPTYRHLEQIFNILSMFEHFDLGVLHSTVDLDDCLNSMTMASSSTGRSRMKRKILLASAIADSSVTIPNVSCVIDTCRALEVKWNHKKAKYNTATVWASQAICDQRRGRTGRTCSGKVFPLVHQSFYNNFMEQWEQPKLELASCRDEVLSLLSSTNKVMSDPQALLRKCIDPPPTVHVTDAMQYLKDVGACREVIVSRKRKLILTEHGELLSALPFSVQEAGTIVYGAKQGLLHEALALVSIKSARPQPIVNAFGNDESNRLNLSRYFPQVEPKDPNSVAIAHLAAYIFWYKNWNKIRRYQMKEHFKNCTGGSSSVISSQFFGEHSGSDKFDYNVGVWTQEMEKVHSDWCREHFINPSSVKSITQYIEVALKTLYRSDVDPEWLKCQPLEPVWNRDQTVEIRQDVFSSLYGTVQGRELSMTLGQLQGQTLPKGGDRVKSSEYACIHYLNGHCRFGDDCMNTHSLSAPRPPCRFHLRGGCTNANCVYSHNEELADTTSEASMISPTHGKFHGGALAWYRQDSSSILLLGNCGFEQSLEEMGCPPGIALGGSISELVHFHKNRYLFYQAIKKVAWNFPASSATDEENESILRGFFMSASGYFQSKIGLMSQFEIGPVSHFEVGLALQGNQFSKWNVMHVAQHAGFFLEWYEDFDSAMFPSYMPRDANNVPMQIHDAKFYVFRMKKNGLHDPHPKMMEIRQGAQFGIELEMSSAGHLTRDYIARNLSHSGIIVDNIESTWREVKRTSLNWKIVGDGSLICNQSQPGCNRFEIVSPILLGEKGLRSATNILKRLSNINVTVNKSMGFHVHFDVAKYSIADLVKICQQFVKYEHAIDSMLPHSRRTGSKESDNYFNSNTKLAKEKLGKGEEGVLNALGWCTDYHNLADILNPIVPSMKERRYFKLNLQNLTTNRQSTIEFRQHSSTGNYEKVDAWVRFIVRFCENSVSLEKPTSFTNALHSIDKQFDDLFKNVIRDSALYSYYKKRRHLLSVDEEGDSCCHGCVTGQRCSK
mmetsp:Transcript_20051/g.43473  ORF Transcript_20051/g.43473 Transcript_20051/m.43473 type:complete len:1281 (-) Transcript_20051:189-4031(-)